MSPLFTYEELEAMHEKYLSEHPVRQVERRKTRAEILLEVYRENPALTISELSEASSRSERWVRKHLQDAGISVERAPRRKQPGTRRKRIKITRNTKCARCGHPRGDERARLFKQPSHCLGHVFHGHWSDPAAYTCTSTHCLTPGCDCQSFMAPAATETEAATEAGETK